MADDVRQQLARVTVKSQLLIDRYNAINQHYQAALTRIDELENEMRKLRSESALLRNKLEYLKAANTISPSREDVARTKVMLSEILREIDKCIERLTY